MSQFDDIVADYGTSIIFEHSGDDATFTPGGDGTPVACTVILSERDSRDENRNGELFRVRGAELVVRRSEAVAIPGDTFTVAAVVWVVIRQTASGTTAPAYDVENHTPTGAPTGDYQEVL